MRLPSFALILGAALGCQAGLHAADAAPMSISAWGNRIIVTAPGDEDSGQVPKIALGMHLTVDFKDSSIEEVANFLRSASHQNIVVAPGLINKSTTMTLKADGMTLANVLGWIGTLTGAHVSYVHEAIYLSDKPATGASKTVIYDVSDLVMPIRDFPGPTMGFGTKPGKAGGGFLPANTKDDKTTTSADEIVELIKKVVSPGDWHE